MRLYSSPDWVAEPQEVYPLKQTDCSFRKGKLWACKIQEVCLSKMGKAGEPGTAWRTPSILIIFLHTFVLFPVIAYCNLKLVYYECIFFYSVNLRLLQLEFLKQRHLMFKKTELLLIKDNSKSNT